LSENEIFEELKDYFPKTVTSNFKKEYPATATLLTMFDTSATFIKNSIFNLLREAIFYPQTDRSTNRKK